MDLFGTLMNIFFYYKMKLTSFTLLAVLFSSFFSCLLLLLFSAALVCCCPSNNGMTLMERQKVGKSNVRNRQRECYGVMVKIHKDRNWHIGPQWQGTDDGIWWWTGSCPTIVHILKIIYWQNLNLVKCTWPVIVPVHLQRVFFLPTSMFCS